MLPQSPLHLCAVRPGSRKNHPSSALLLQAISDLEPFQRERQFVRIELLLLLLDLPSAPSTRQRTPCPCASQPAATWSSSLDIWLQPGVLVANPLSPNVSNSNGSWAADHRLPRRHCQIGMLLTSSYLVSANPRPPEPWTNSQAQPPWPTTTRAGHRTPPN